MADLPVAGTILVYALPPIWGAPSPSPFVIKLLTFLRMAELPHRLVPLTGPPKSSTGKIPYIELPNGERLHDSGLIQAELTERLAVRLDEGLTAEQVAQSLLVRRAVEEHLYFVGAYERWLTPQGWPATARDYFSHLPFPLGSLLPLVLRRRIRANMHGQGIGRHPWPTIVAEGTADLDALATLLGDREFFHGRPSTIDATLYGFFRAWTSNPFTSEPKAALCRHPNLVAYVARMKERYWADEA